MHLDISISLAGFAFGLTVLGIQPQVLALALIFQSCFLVLQDHLSSVGCSLTQIFKGRPLRLRSSPDLHGRLFSGVDSSRLWMEFSLPPFL